MCRLLSLLLLLAASTGLGAETLPSPPTRYFNDYTGTIRPDVAAALNSKLEAFEKESSSQVVVAMFSRLPPNAALEDYANRLFRAWKIGQGRQNNGILLLVFKDDRRLRIEVGYGLEGVLPDALANRIIANEIVPAFKRGDFNGGLTAGVDAILQAARGEYKGTGRTVAQGRRAHHTNPVPFIILLFLFFIVMSAVMRRAARRGTMYHRRRRSYWGPVWMGGGWGGGGFGGGGWGSSGGGFSGGFSGGGGSSGGGGASGSW